MGKSSQDTLYFIIITYLEIHILSLYYSNNNNFLNNKIKLKLIITNVVSRSACQIKNYLISVGFYNCFYTIQTILNYYNIIII